MRRFITSYSLSRGFKNIVFSMLRVFIVNHLLTVEKTLQSKVNYDIIHTPWLVGGLDSRQASYLLQLGRALFSCLSLDLVNRIMHFFTRKMRIAFLRLCVRVAQHLLNEGRVNSELHGLCPVSVAARIWS